MNEFELKTALANYEKRRVENKGKKINNSLLPAGSPMHYFCKFCGIPTVVLPETHTIAPKTACDPCEYLHLLGEI